MKIGKLTRINDKGNIELASSLLNLNIRSSRHSAMIRQVESRTDRYSVWISSNKTDGIRKTIKRRPDKTGWRERH